MHLFIHPLFNSFIESFNSFSPCIRYTSLLQQQDPSISFIRGWHCVWNMCLLLLFLLFLYALYSCWLAIPSRLSELLCCHDWCSLLCLPLRRSLYRNSFMIFNNHSVQPLQSASRCTILNKSLHAGELTARSTMKQPEFCFISSTPAMISSVSLLSGICDLKTCYRTVLNRDNGVIMSIPAGDASVPFPSGGVFGLLRRNSYTSLWYRSHVDYWL